MSERKNRCCSGAPGALRMLVSLALLAVMGCGPGGPKVVKIEGTVTRGGRPLKDMLVTFFPERGRPSSGLTDAQGHYVLQYTADRPGAVVGKHKVAVWYRPEDRESLRKLEEGRFVYPPEMQAIHAKYGKRETTPLEFDIQKSQTIDLKLD